MHMSKSIFLFPGQGSQYVGMGKDFYENFSIVKHIFEEAEDALNIKLKKLCFEGPESDLKLTSNTQPAVLTVSVAAYKVLAQETDIRPSLLAGHSLGEYSALVVSQVLKFSDAVRLVRLRGQAMQEAVPVGKGAMAALIGAEANSAKALCDEVSKKGGSFVSVANYNGGGQVVISGESPAVKRAVEMAPSKGIKRAIMLEVSAPFHCKLMEPAAKKMSEFFERHSRDSGNLFSKIQIPYIANVDAQIYSGDPAHVKDLLVQQIPNSVRWEESMQRLSEQSIEAAYEVSPGKVLSGLLKRINKDIPIFSIQSVSDIKALSQ